MPFVHRHRVRYHECDLEGIVFNAHWFTYFDVALTEWFREALGSYEAFGTDVVVAETGARFHAPARFDEEIEIEVAAERMGTTSMTVTFTARRDGTTLVEGRTVYVCVDPATLAKREIPDHARAALSAP